MKQRSRNGRRGQSMVEFAIILVLVACVAIAAITVTGNELVKTYEDINQAVTNPTDTTSSTPFTCPDGTTAVLRGHKYHCHP
jgi:Flp pilus assembly pilin Flp